MYVNSQTALTLCQFKKDNCTDPYQSVKEIAGGLAKAHITGRECRVSVHQEANTKVFILTCREVRSSRALCPRSYSTLLPASFLKKNRSVHVTLCLNDLLDARFSRLKFKI